MRKTEVFGIDIPELGDPSDITVVSDAIHDVENAMGCKIEFMNAVSTPGLISLNSKVRIHPYTTYYDDMVFAFIAPVDIPVGNSIAIKIDDLPQQPFNNEAFNGKGSLVFITYNTKSGFKSYENGSKIINNLTTGGANDALSAEMGKQLQNNKLDKGNVSTEYDTAKKIEDKIEGQQINIQTLQNSKLDKTDAWRIQPKELPNGSDLNNIIEPGFYYSEFDSNIAYNKPSNTRGAFELTVTTIQPLHNNEYTTQLFRGYGVNIYYTRSNVLGEWTQWQKIALEDEVVKKSGDTMTGNLTIKSERYSEVSFSDPSLSAVGYDSFDKRSYLKAGASNSGLNVFGDGTTTLQAMNLQTPHKEVVGAINDMYRNSLIYMGDIGRSIPTAEELFNLDIGIYAVTPTHDIYQAPTGWYYMVKLTPPEIMDQKVILYKRDGSGDFFIGDSNGKDWLGWRNFRSVHWSYIGKINTVGGVVSVSGYSDILVVEMNSDISKYVQDIKYLPRRAIELMSTYRFISSSSSGEECSWEFIDNGNNIKLVSLGNGNDGGIIVYGR